ncbi:MAG: transcriptional regulator NrdR [Synergistaceae bacterium]|nr:transcriptional regulator NrdR [Synergistaceae bacterium]
MKCPNCGTIETRVVDSRIAEDGDTVRRRRECPECQLRFTTYERTEERRSLRVTKKDGRREVFARDKILRGIIKSCEKLPITLEQIEEIAAKVEKQLRDEIDGDVPVTLIGEKIMDELKRVNKVAYVRFASVYREFTDIDNFQKEISYLLTEKVNS